MYRIFFSLQHSVDVFQRSASCHHLGIIRLLLAQVFEKIIDEHLEISFRHLQQCAMCVCVCVCVCAHVHARVRKGAHALVEL